MNELEEIKKKLQYPFSAENIKYRVQSSGYTDENTYVIIIPYIDARDVQKRFDDVIGWDKWEPKYQPIQNGFICTIRIFVDGRWIEKQDGAEYTAGVKGHEIKGGFSEAFKRTASAGYGVGRHLYNLKEEFADISNTSKYGYEKIWIKKKYSKTNEGKWIWWKKANKNSTGNKIEETEGIKETIVKNDRCENIKEQNINKIESKPLVDRAYKEIGKEKRFEKKESKLKGNIKNLYDILIVKAENDEIKCQELLYQYTKFKTNDGKEIGKRDFHTLSEKWASITLDKVNKNIGGVN